jgi:hypothetical protein
MSINVYAREVMMRTLIVLLAIFLLGDASVAQDRESQFASRKAVTIPQSIYAVAIMHQPDCPLKIERASILRRLDGRRLNVYEVQNIGPKAITSFSVAIWNSNNTGDVIPWSAKSPDTALSQGQNQDFGLAKDVEIVPLNNTLRKELGFEGALRGVVFFMVTEVIFSDGTEYHGMSLLDSIENHLKLCETKYDRRQE